MSHRQSMCSQFFILLSISQSLHSMSHLLSMFSLSIYCAQFINPSSQCLIAYQCFLYLYTALNLSIPPLNVSSPINVFFIYILLSIYQSIQSMSHLLSMFSLSLNCAQFINPSSQCLIAYHLQAISISLTTGQCHTSSPSYLYLSDHWSMPHFTSQLSLSL